MNEHPIRDGAHRVGLALVWGALAFGCSGAEFRGPAGSGGGGGLPSGVGGDVVSGRGGAEPAGTGGASSVATGPSCPVDKPATGSSCSNANMTCSYGAQPRPSCRTRLQCSGGRWIALQAGTCAGDPTCPRDEPSGGDACGALHQVCSYPDRDTFCACPPCAAFCSNETWACATSPGGGCPKVLPNEGGSCEGARECSYGLCAIGDAMTARCAGGRWQWEAADCG